MIFNYEVLQNKTILTYQLITLHIINVLFQVSNYSLHSDLKIQTVSEVIIFLYTFLLLPCKLFKFLKILALDSMNIPKNIPRTLKRNWYELTNIKFKKVLTVKNK